MAEKTVADTTMTSVAAQCMQDLVDECENEKKSGKPVTLVYWRLGKHIIRDLLQKFASKPEWKEEEDRGEQLAEVLGLFRELNTAMSEQDKMVWPADMARKPGENELPVVFGGKYAQEPNSISEQLVDILADSCSKVYTVSRSKPLSAPDHVIHIVKQNLKEKDGAIEFQEVLELVTKEWESSEKTLVLYFTLGQHTGENAFQKNIQAATNFCIALSKLDLKDKPFRVVVTGTDATLPSTHPDSSTEIDGQEYTVPSYRIFKYNFVYAMSKLCQFYMIANVIVKKTGSTDAAVSNLQETIDKMVTHITAAGNDGIYHEEQTDGISLEELNVISANWPSIESALDKHIMVAKEISICYTLLHAEPWTNQAFVKCDKESNGSPRAFMIQQVVRRTKNAVSSEKAARAHFPSSE